MPMTMSIESHVAHDRAGGFSYVDSEILVVGEAAAVRLVRLAGREAAEWRADDEPLADHPWIRFMDDRAAREELIDSGDFPPDHTWLRVSGVVRPAEYIRALRSEGHVAQPNHVFGAHSGCCSCGPHPSWITAVMSNPMSGNPMSGNPMSGNPMSGNPMSGNPMSGNPMSGNPMSGNPMSGNPKMINLAVPATGRVVPVRTMAGRAPKPKVLVLDTGIADDRPPLLSDGGRFTGDSDKPDVKLTNPFTGVTAGPDGYLDPVAGHGTFIAGIVEQLSPGCSLHVHRVLSPFGIAQETDVAAAIAAAVDGSLAGYKDVPDIINLSLGGPVMEHPFHLAAAVGAATTKGIVVVASAGNAGTCRPQYPAALDGVVAVAALGPDGPAPWTNYGCWVDACAPGTDLISAFFNRFDGDFPMRNTVDEDNFDDWASWSGTSFAAPVVVAAIAREMMTGQGKTTSSAAIDAVSAVERVLYAPHLMRLPGLGTVVNI